MNRKILRTTRLGPAFALLAMALVLALNSGCGGPGPVVTYGTSTGGSLNGTDGFAGLLRSRGHQVRFAHHLTEDLANWAEVIVRFAARPGPPDQDEADWYVQWLQDRPQSDLLYVVRDYDGEVEYWDRVLGQFTAATDPAIRAEAEERRERAAGWINRLPSPAKNPADASFWFAAGESVGEPLICASLGGLWGHDLEPVEVALPLHQPIAPGDDHVILSGDGHAIVTEWHIEGGGNALMLANGSFLLNLPLAIPGRRPLAERTARWIGDQPRRIAFVSGASPLGESDAPPSLVEWITEDPTTRWVAFQFALFGLIACLARAPILGRPRPEPAGETDRPAAHAEALGSLLERGKDAEAARGLLAAYRRWRFPHASREIRQGRPQPRPRRR